MTEYDNFKDWLNNQDELQDDVRQLFFKKPSVEECIRTCKTDWLAALHLGHMEGDGVVEGLSEALGADIEEDDPFAIDVTLAAAYSLGLLKDRSAVDALIQLTEKYRRELLWMAAWALGEIGDSKAIEALQASLDRDCFEEAWESGNQITEGLKDMMDEEDVYEVAYIAFLDFCEEEIFMRDDESPVVVALGRLGE